MSLINEALKRAKDAQQNAPAPPIAGPPSTPGNVEEAEEKHRSFSAIAAIVSGLLFVVVLGWHLLQRNEEPITTRARTQPASETAAAVARASDTSLTTSAKPAASAKAPSTVSATATPQVAAASVTATNSPVAPAPAALTVPPPPPEPRLQAIIYSPKRPSAIINGKTLFVGDRFGEFRLTAVTQDSATLNGAEGTKVLMLQQ